MELFNYGSDEDAQKSAEEAANEGVTAMILDNLIQSDASGATAGTSRPKVELQVDTLIITDADTKGLKQAFEARDEATND